MNKRNHKRRRSFREYMRETYKNKLTAIGLLACGSLPMLVDKDATVFVFMMVFAIPLFFEKHNCIR